MFRSVPFCAVLLRRWVRSAPAQLVHSPTHAGFGAERRPGSILRECGVRVRVGATLVPRSAPIPACERTGTAHATPRWVRFAPALPKMFLFVPKCSFLSVG